MSYCRWSSDFWQCDVYVYASDRGWETHVAGRRLKHTPPAELVAQGQAATTAADYVALWRAIDAWRESLPSDEHPCKYIDPTAPGGMRPGTFKSPKDSEYFDLTTIGPEAGQSFVDPSASACAARLEALRARGFNVPQSAIDRLRSEEPEP